MSLPHDQKGIVPEKLPTRPVPVHPANHGLADKEIASHDEQKP